MTTMDREYGYQFREGMTVYGADGGKVGTVVAVDPAFVVVEKGFFFPTDYYVPTRAVASADADNLYLTVSKDEALHQGWDQPPASTGYGTETTGHATKTTAATGAASAEGRDRIAVPLHEEELVATKRPVEEGAVRIEKDVVTEERTIDVPVTEERVRVSRVPASGEAAADATAFEEGVIEVPLRGEEVDVEKRARRTGEVVVEKEEVQRTERVGGQVRREQVRVDDRAVESGTVEETRGEATQ